MSIDTQKVEIALEHFASGFLSFAKAAVHIAAAAAPVAAQVAQQTGHADVVDDINKAGAAAGAADSLFNRD